MPVLSARMKPKDAWTFFILPIVTALLIASVCSVTDQQDVAVLQNLYTSLNSTAQLTGWSAQGSSSDPCTQAWKGVTCVGTSVTELNLANLGLSGGLGYMLQQLTSVHVFDVSGNSFSGSVPYQLPPNLVTLNMERNSFSGNLPYSIAYMVNLTTLKFAHNQLSGELVDVFSSLSSLNFLDLSFNQLTGDLPSSFVHLQSLATLYLQSNQFTGTLNVLDSVQSLTNVNVENNKFTGWVPAVFQNNGNFQYSGNDFSSSPAPPPPPYTPPPARSSPPSTRGSGTNSSPNSSSNNNGNNENKSSGLSGGAVAGIVIVILLAVLAGSIALFCLFKKKKRKNVSDEEARIHTGAAMGSTFQPSTQVVEEKPKPKLVESSTALKPPPMEWFKGEKESGKKSAKKKSADIVATAFSVAELQVATNSFSQDNLVGEGALGRVYRADIPSGKVLAVKKIDALSSDTLQNDEDFMEIVSNISRLRHSNIAELVGYCTEHRQRLLMYDYYSKGTLHDILHSADDNLKRELVWNIRVKIALGAARALEYLHEVCLPAVVHKNFKSGNILLDEELNPHLADCGIAVFSPSLDPQASNLGYSAPEHAMSGIYTAKSDVYSFGVVMLELLTGRKPLDSSRPRSEQSLVRWATPQLHDIDALDKMVDPVLNGMYPAKSLSRFADVIALCVQPEPEFRPPISEVVQSLVRLMQRASSSTMNKRRAGGEEQNNNDSYDAIV